MKTFLRIVKWAVALGAVSVIALVLLITFLPPTTYETQFEVDRPVEETWAMFMDPSRATEWLPGLESMETLEGEPGEVGARYLLTFDEEGTKVEMHEEMTEIEPLEMFAFTLQHELMDGTIRVELEDLGGRTRVTTHNEVMGKGVLKPFVPIMKGDMIERQEQGYAKLKELIESE